MPRARKPGSPNVTLMVMPPDLSFSQAPTNPSLTPIFGDRLFCLTGPCDAVRLEAVSMSRELLMGQRRVKSELHSP
ncbi:hypothetical protein LZ30DRAFT_704898 [Colletotrichum cereale]|nr:hypothetical protein LZ30DRAFT_704898 [Colletotrichum cereale]